MMPPLLDRADKLSARLVGLHRVGVSLVSRLEECEIVAVVLEEAARLLGVTSAAMFLWDEAQQRLRFASAAPTRLSPPDFENELGTSLVWQAWQRGQTMVVNDYASSPHATAADLRAGITAAVAAPLAVDGRKLGTLIVRDCDIGAAFDAEDGVLLELLAGQAAAALERARLDAELRANAEVSAALLRLAREVSPVDDELALVQRVADLAVQLFGADACVASLRDPHSGELYRAAYSGDILPAERIYLDSQVSSRRSSGIQGLATSMSAPLLIEDVQAAGYYSAEFLANVRRRSGIHVPLVAGQISIGFLGIHWTQQRRTFTERDRALAEGLARLLTGALERARGNRQVRLLSDAVAASVDGIAVSDLNGQLQIANPTYARLLGYELEALTRINLRQLHRPLPGQDLGNATDWLSEVARRGTWAGEVVALRRDGSELPARLSLSVVNGPGGRPVGLCATLRDLTQEREVQERLVRSEKLRALGQLAAGAAHDFNNLLTMVLVRAELARQRLLAGQAGRAELVETLQVIERAAEDGASTVRQIQDFTRVRPERPPERVPIGPLVAQVLDLTRPRWQDEPQRRGCKVQVVRRIESGLACAGQAAELREALTNLMLNAVDALPEGGQIIIRADQQASRIRLQVTDTGVGMTDEVRRQIFDPFFSTKGERGTGLGLSMVYAMVQRHGGEIEVQSELGQGTTFTLLLPAAGEATAPAGPEPTSTPALAGARVLVVDDEPGLAAVLGQVLSTAAHRVTLCSSGREALDQFRPGRFDVVVTDLGMPNMDGLELSSRLKALDPNLGILMVTGWGSQVDPEDAREHGVDVIVAKPYRLRHILNVIGSLVDRRARV